MSQFVVAETATGVVFNVCRVPEAFAAIQGIWPKPPGHALYEATFDLSGLPTDYYVAGGVVLERAEHPVVLSAETMLADGIDEVTLSGLLTPCTVQISGAVSATATVSSGTTFSFTCSVVGTLTIRVTKDPTHKPWEGSVIAG